MNEDKVIEQDELVDEEITLDDRLVELEVYKETKRVEREEESFEFVEYPDKVDEIYKDICRDADAFANFYTRLVMAGVHSDTAGQLLNNYMTFRYNAEIAKIDVEKAKYQSVQIQQSMV